MNRIPLAITRLVLDEPFFAALLLRLKTSEQNTGPCFTTDGRSLFYNPARAEKLTDPQLKTALCETVLHLAMGHPWRGPAAADWNVWNRAGDQEARAILAQSNDAARGRSLAEPFPFPEGLQADQRFRGVAAEKIYATLLAEKPPPSDGKGEGEAGAEGGGQAVGQVCPHTAGAAGGSSFAEFTRPAQETERRELAEEWKLATLQAAAAAKARGRLPAGLQRLVQEITTPRVDWRETLRDYIRDISQADYIWSSPNLRYADTGFFLPSPHSERLGKIIFATDTSGSIDQELLNAFHAEKKWVLEELQPESLIDLCCDAAITQEREYAPGDAIERKAPGGGGTDFMPVFERVATLPEPPAVLIYLTDLDGSFPKTIPDYPVIWCVWGGKTDAPFGVVIPVPTG